MRNLERLSACLLCLYALAAPAVYAQPPAGPETEPPVEVEPVAPDAGEEEELAPVQATPSPSEQLAAPTTAAVPATTAAYAEASPSPAPTPTPEIRRWRVRSGSNEAEAFAFGDANHLLTSAQVVRHRGSVRVIDPATGDSFSASLAGVDSASGLALIRTEQSVGEPATVAASAQVGDVVQVRSDSGLSTGLVVSARDVSDGSSGAARLELSAVCVEGAALTNTAGQIVGACTARSQAAASSAFAALWEGQSASADRSAWRTQMTIEFRYRMQKGFEAGLGGQLGLGVVGWDRLGFMLRGALTSDAEKDEGNVTLNSPIEITGEVQIQHAFRVAGIPLRLILGAGALFRVERTNVTQTFAEFDRLCDLAAGRCPVTYSEEVTENVAYRVLPNLRAEVDIGGMALSYSATFDVDDIEATTHSLGLGVTF